MKTTFKEVIRELDDELTDIGFNTEHTPDIDIEKIKGEVFMRINENKSGKKPLGKSLFVILAAAVILAAGTIGAVASGSIRAVFDNYFKSEAEMNDLGLFGGENVEITTYDDTLNVELLGTISDGETGYSAIAVTKKDGSPIIGEDQYLNSRISMWMANSFEFIRGDEEPSQRGAITRARAQLSDDRTTLYIYSDYTRSEDDLNDLRVTYHNNIIGGYRIDRVIYEEEMPEIQLGEGAEEYEEGERGRNATAQAYAADRLREEYGINEDECIWARIDNKFVYAQGEEIELEIPFDLSFDFVNSVNDMIESEISAESEPEIVQEYTRNAKVTISPLGVYLSGECDEINIEYKRDWEDKCFISPDLYGGSYALLDDGTIYYIIINEGGQRTADDSGVYHETVHLDYSLTKGMQLDLGSNRITVDIDKIQTVVINGDTVYTK